MCSVLYLSQTRGCDICPDTLICEVRVQTSTLPAKHQSREGTPSLYNGKGVTFVGHARTACSSETK